MNALVSAITSDQSADFVIPFRLAFTPPIAEHHQFVHWRSKTDPFALFRHHYTFAVLQFLSSLSHVFDEVLVVTSHHIRAHTQ